MLIETLLKGLIYIIKILFVWLKTIFPAITIPTQFYYTLGIILSTTSQANNFIYFIMGDTAYVLVPLVIALITYKYVVYPIATFILQFIHNAG